jgi:uncharacterized protein (TIGR03083 family)
MGWLSQERYEQEFRAETARFTAAAGRHDPAAVVPACPEWTYRDLVAHVGSGHRYAAEVITAARTEPLPPTRLDPPEHWPDWLREGAEQLIGAAREHGFGAPVWTWQPTDRTAGFWVRRMLHDEIVHRFDADPAGALAPDLAADGVSDFLATVATLTGLPIGMHLTGTGETLQFRATDDAGVWHVTLTPAGVRWRTGEGAADETVEAPARDLLLMLNRRIPPVAPGPLFTRWIAATTF